jgi:hypothetical protein
VNTQSRGWILLSGPRTRLIRSALFKPKPTVRWDALARLTQWISLPARKDAKGNKEEKRKGRRLLRTSCFPTFRGIHLVEYVICLQKAKLKLGKGKKLPANQVDTSFKARCMCYFFQCTAHLAKLCTKLSHFQHRALLSRKTPTHPLQSGNSH